MIVSSTRWPIHPHFHPQNLGVRSGSSHSQTLLDVETYGKLFMPVYHLRGREVHSTGS
jgi:hypothetical protein